MGDLPTTVHYLFVQQILNFSVLPKFSREGKNIEKEFTHQVEFESVILHVTYTTYNLFSLLQAYSANDSQ